MKKMYFALLALTGYSLASLAQCTPDLSITQSGLYPRVLPSATEGVPYSQVLQFKVPKDTLSLKVDSMYILAVSGMPASFVHQCNQVICAYKGDQNGCAVLSGTAPLGSAGTFNIKVTAKVILRSPIPLVPPVTQTFVEDLDLQVDQPVGLKEKWQALTQKKVLVIPNPFKEQCTLTFTLHQSQQATLTIYDRMGRVQSSMEKYLESNAYSAEWKIDASSWPSGMYVYRLQLANGNVYTGRLIRN